MNSVPHPHIYFAFDYNLCNMYPRRKDGSTKSLGGGVCCMLTVVCCGLLEWATCNKYVRPALQVICSRFQHTSPPSFGEDRYNLPFVRKRSCEELSHAAVIAFL
ncbi:uncharacterized protein LOC117150063 [Drosophila mauritiana]|uniref:Uncharacterized protein LOC117150063 n=1 Tax=Drosophila mauritiana TaxID=7226 RepID=A0A6P8KRI4_DROMA|nr:uncharacterized protein LOC117150063 [Drosophila mauritiana]